MKTPFLELIIMPFKEIWIIRGIFLLMKTGDSSLAISTFHRMLGQELKNKYVILPFFTVMENVLEHTVKYIYLNLFMNFVAK